MLGQVAYHLLAAVHATRAPWPVVMLVSCLPVIALALGTALAHLLRDPETAADVPAVPVPEPVPVADDVLEDTVTDEVPVPSVPDEVPAKRARVDDVPEHAFTAELEAGTLPSLREVKSRMRVGTDRAREIRGQLAQALEPQTEEVRNAA